MGSILQNLYYEVYITSLEHCYNNVRPTLLTMSVIVVESTSSNLTENELSASYHDQQNDRTTQFVSSTKKILPADSSDI